MSTHSLSRASVSFPAFKSTGEAAGTGWEFTTVGASESDWNFKFEYPQGGTSTLTMKDAKLINAYEGNKPMYKDGASTSTWTGIQPRNMVVSIILTIVTCGIYGVYWFIVLTDEMNRLTNDEKNLSGLLSFVLTLVTCGIYSFIWSGC